MYIIYTLGWIPYRMSPTQYTCMTGFHVHVVGFIFFIAMWKCQLFWFHLFIFRGEYSPHLHLASSKSLLVPNNSIVARYHKYWLIFPQPTSFYMHWQITLHTDIDVPFCARILGWYSPSGQIFQRAFSKLILHYLRHV